MQNDSDFLRAQARKCRWLADRVNGRDVIEALLKMAAEYEDEAAQGEGGATTDID
jgi:hypothetical protein